jgi:hypothetical protein
MLNWLRSLSPNTHASLIGVGGVAVGFAVMLGAQSMMHGSANMATAKAATIETGQLAQPGAQPCGRSVRVLCAGVAPGSGRIKECIRNHLAELAPDCRAAIDARLQRQFRQQRLQSTNLMSHE